MSYQALYRKHRPDTFNDVKGQDHIAETLKNQIKLNRIGHAYLFCGTRGTGKTTVAKIFAKAVNCEHPVNGSPCGECAMCKSIAAGSSVNVIEIDAASNNGVDNIREIRNEVEYTPANGKYRVYIIDEVHMLSIGAFNALLKTLEEPPSYIIFILATTEPHKLPITILSRCQRYDFKRITIDTIAMRLKELADKEELQVEDKALRYIAKAADGSMRDALSLLDQCTAFHIGEKLTYEMALEVLGAVDTGVFSELLKNILDDDVKGALAVVDDIIVKGREINQFANDFIWYLRNLLLIKDIDNPGELLDISSENAATMKAEAEEVSSEVLMRYIRVFSELSADMKYATQKRVLLEVAIIKLCKPEMEKDVSSLINRIEKMERKLERGVVVRGVAAPQNQSMDTPIEEEAPEPKELVKAMPEDIKKLIGNWNKVLNSFKTMSTGRFLSKAMVSAGEGNTVVLGFKESLGKNYFEEQEHKDELISVLQKIIGKEVSVSLHELKTEEERREFIDPTLIDISGIEVVYDD